MKFLTFHEIYLLRTFHLLPVIVLNQYLTLFKLFVLPIFANKTAESFIVSILIFNLQIRIPLKKENVDMIFFQNLKIGRIIFRNVGST